MRDAGRGTYRALRNGIGAYLPFERSHPERPLSFLANSPFRPATASRGVGGIRRDQRLAERRVGRAERIDQARERLEVKLAEMGLKATVTGRPKHIYSIACKMDRKQVDFEQIFDVHALRVILVPSDKAAYALKSG